MIIINVSGYLIIPARLCKGIQICHINFDINPFTPVSANWILLCLMPDDFTRQWGTPWELKG